MTTSEAEVVPLNEHLDHEDDSVNSDRKRPIYEPALAVLYLAGRSRGPGCEKWTATAMSEDIRTLYEIALARQPHEHDISSIVPIIRPYDWLDGGYSGPIVQLTDLPFSLAWAVWSAPHISIYVTYEMAQYWEETGVDWPEEAMKNLRRIAQSKRMSGARKDENGKTTIVAMLTDDAIGPSRLLIPDLFADIFGEDYMVAIPEQTCAIAYPKDLPESEMAAVDGMIEGCYRKGTTPLSPERFEASRFMLKEVRVKLTYG